MKHAFLIMAYNNWNLLERLMTVLDDSRNHFYIHIDLKSKDFDQSRYSNLLSKASVTFIKRENIYWAGFSEAWCEVRLIEAALEDGFDYCHVLSGVDFPLKTMDQINDFIENNAGKEFIEFNPNWYDIADYKANHYHLFVDNKYYRNKKWLHACDFGLVKLQQILHIDRYKGKIYSGSAFFSISEEFAKYVISNKETVKKRCKKTRNGVEIYLQNIIMGSPFENNIYDFESPTGNLRLIDWSRNDGNKNSPWTFKMQDYEMLISTPEHVLFARKFDEKVDWNIIEKLTEYLRTNR